MKMLDYVQLAHVRMGENLERSSELVAQLVDIFQSGSFNALRIVASGSSRHAADCARDFLQDALQMQVSVVTPECSSLSGGGGNTGRREADAGFHNSFGRIWRRNAGRRFIGRAHS